MQWQRTDCHLTAPGGQRLYPPHACGEVAPCRRGGFTIIEMLVVISIIVLLISLLLPALGTARDAARSMSCLVRMRTFGQFTVIYTSDFDGWYPPNDFSWNAIATPYYLSWAEAMEPYVEYRSNYTRGSSDSQYLCPGTDFVGSATAGAADIAPYATVYFGHRPSSYAPSAWYGIASQTSLGSDLTWQPKRNTFHESSRLGLLYETNWNTFSSWVGYLDDFSSRVAYNHPTQSTNMLFVDGHAQNMGNTPLHLQWNVNFLNRVTYP